MPVKSARSYVYVLYSIRYLIICVILYIGALAEDEGETQLNLLLNSLNRSVSGSNALNQTTVSAHTGNLSPSPSLTSPYQTTVHSPVDPLLGGHNYEDGPVTGGDVYNTVYNGNNMAGTTSIGSGSLLKMLKSAKNKVHTHIYKKTYNIYFFYRVYYILLYITIYTDTSLCAYLITYMYTRIYNHVHTTRRSHPKYRPLPPSPSPNYFRVPSTPQQQ